MACDRRLGFIQERAELVTFEALDGGATGAAPLGNDAAPSTAQLYTPAGGSESYRACANSGDALCNWMVRVEDADTLCLACRLNKVVPDLSVPENRDRWVRIEAAKRRLLFTLLGLGLEVVPKTESPQAGLAFDFKASTSAEKILTGHDDGLITLNIDEADPVLREQARLAVKERYRTLLGHLRHEIGHYYWDRLVPEHDDRLERFRKLFGDERDDYAAALKRHYERTQPGNWTNDFVSEYASSHPWEDWAETFAHYLHMVDLLETAHSFGVRLSKSDASKAAGFQALLADFMGLTVVLNALTRSIGHEDAYPFALGDGTQLKLAFVHELIVESAQQPKPSAAPAALSEAAPPA